MNQETDIVSIIEQLRVAQFSQIVTLQKYQRYFVNKFQRYYLSTDLKENKVQQKRAEKDAHLIESSYDVEGTYEPGKLQSMTDLL